MVDPARNTPLDSTSQTAPSSAKKSGKENRASQVFDNAVGASQPASTGNLSQKTVKPQADQKTEKAARSALPTAQPQDPKTKLEGLKTKYAYNCTITYSAETKITTGAQSHLENALLTLISCQKAMQGFAYSDSRVKQVLASFDLEHPSKDMAQKIKAAFVEQLTKSQRAAFLEKVEIERGKLLPPTLEHTFTVNNQEYVERREFIDNWASVSYLETFGDRYKAQIDFIKENNVRNGPLKKPQAAQGMLLNGQVHTLANNKGSIDTTVRSGAFCVHGTMPKNDDPLNLSVAQALAKITTGIQLILADPTKLEMSKKTGEFLYVEQSFLSTADADEITMCKHMKAAMDYLSQNAQVEFSTNEQDQKVEMKDGKLVLTIYKPGLEGATYNLRSILFVEGVNEMQTLGQAFKPKAIAYQNQLNLEARASLLERAEKLKDSQNINPFITHFFDNKTRENKDIQGVAIIRDTVKILGGIRGVSCKTGKDRTGAEVNDALASEAEKTDKTKKHNVRDKLAGGISYRITGENTGKHNAYAFNWLQQKFLPPEWFPPKQYCGGGPS